MKDTLESATRALRQAPVDHARSDETRARLMAGVRQKRGVPKRRFGPWLVPIAAAFVASAALAGAGSRIVAWLAPAPIAAPVAVSSNAVVVKPAAPASSRVADTMPAPAASVESVPPLAAAPADGLRAAQVVASSGTVPSSVAPSPRVEHAVPAVAVDTSRPPVAAPSAPAVPPAAPTAAAAPPGEPAVAATASASVDPSDELYRAAHDLHFRGGSAAAAVSAWDRYLAAAPGGRFALEATFNRAIALLRAGRRAECLAALRPFANGAHGAYRREEAKRLLDAAEDAGAP